MSGRSRAYSDVTRAQPPAAAGVLLPLSLGGPPFLVLARVSVSGVLSDDDRRRVVAVGAQGPAGRFVGEDGAAGAELVDQGCGTVRAGQLRQAAVCPVRFPGGDGEQDGDGGQVREDLVLPHVGVRGSSRFWAGSAGVAVAAPVSGLAIGPR